MGGGEGVVGESNRYILNQRSDADFCRIDLLLDNNL